MSAEALPGVGIDVVEIARIRALLEDRGERFRERVFTEAERAECDARPDPAPHYAARFAAKEATMKALGTGWGEGVGFQDVELHSDGKQIPRLELHGCAAERARGHALAHWRVSISHDGGVAAAIVIGSA